MSLSANAEIESWPRLTPMIIVGSARPLSIITLNSAGASLRPVRSPVAPKITIAVGSGRRRFVEGSPRISPTTDEPLAGGGTVGGRVRGGVVIGERLSRERPQGQ